MDTITREYKDIEKRAQKQPGLIELLKAYGEYENVAKPAASYLDATSLSPISSRIRTLLPRGSLIVRLAPPPPGQLLTVPSPPGPPQGP